MAEETTERWAVTAEEADRIETLSGSDELMCTVESESGVAYQVVVQRNGTVTNRNWDGTIGVPEDVRDLANSEDVLYHAVDDGFEETQKWVNVIVGPEGEFLSFADQDSPRP